MPFIGVTFGYTFEPMAALGPDVLVESFDAIQPDETARLLKRRARGTSPRTTAAAAP